MAGLTREQRAAKAAAQADMQIGGVTVDEHEANDDGLIAVTKGADELRVHPSCVKAHQAAGWVLA